MLGGSDGASLGEQPVSPASARAAIHLVANILLVFIQGAMRVGLPLAPGIRSGTPGESGLQIEHAPGPALAPQVRRGAGGLEEWAAQRSMRWRSVPVSYADLPAFLVQAGFTNRASYPFPAYIMTWALVSLAALLVFRQSMRLYRVRTMVI